MNLKFYVLCTAALLALGVFVLPVSGVSALPVSGVPFLADSNITATIHGATYAWDTLEPLNDTVITINSNPPQSIVAKNGTYSFELGPGDYIITAKYYRNKTIIYSKQTTLKIEDKGKYVFDLLLYPASENPSTEPVRDKTGPVNNVNPSEKTGADHSTETDSFADSDSSTNTDPSTNTDTFTHTGSSINSESSTETDSSTKIDPPNSTINYMPVVLTFIVLLIGGYKLSRKHKMIKESRSYQVEDQARNQTGNKAGKLDRSGLLAKAPGKSTRFDENAGLDKNIMGSETRAGFGKARRTVLTPQRFVKPIIEAESNIETKNNPEIEVATLKNLPLSKDLRQILDIIRGHKGRITQKNLRSRLEYSEVKVSLLLSELEKRGLIKKFKHGRENIVILTDKNDG